MDKSSGMPFSKRGIVVLKARGKFAQRDAVGPVPVDFVGRHVDERRLGTGSPGGFEKMQRSKRIHFEIEKGNGGGAVMRRLRGGVDDQVRAHFIEQRQHALAVPNVERGVPIAGDLPAQVLEHPTGIALRPEENRAMVVVDAVNLESLDARRTSKPRSQ